jgi:hypothetical protein
MRWRRWYRLEKKVRRQLAHARKRKGFCWKRRNRSWLYDTLRLFNGYRVRMTSAGVATFSVKFTDPATGKQRTAWLGVYNPETFTVEDARSRA